MVLPLRVFQSYPDPEGGLFIREESLLRVMVLENMFSLLFAFQILFTDIGLANTCISQTH